jgi:ribosomal protein S18 acetylase RimI-like enzyme
MDPIIRRANAGDYDALCAILSEADALHHEAVPWIFRHNEGPARTREYVDGLLADPAVAVFVAEVDGHAAGMVYVLIRTNSPLPIMAPRRFAVVDTLAVAEAYRRRGLARALMAAAEQWAVSQGAQDIELQVYEFNQGAQELYRALGYETVTRRMGKLLR